MVRLQFSNASRDVPFLANARARHFHESPSIVETDVKKTLYIFVRFKAYSGTVVTFKKNDTLKQVGEHVHQRRQRVFIFIFFCV